MKKKRILITGGTGFIGYHLAAKCINLNWEVTSLSSKNNQKLNINKKIKYIFCDVSKRRKLEAILNNKNYDYVVNLAGYVDHSNKKKTLKSHYLGCKNLANIFLKKKIIKFIQIGSSIEYGKLRSPQEEKMITTKTYSVYGYAKLMSTKFLLDLYKKFSFPVSILRLYLVYGPFQSVNRIIPITITNCLEGKKFLCSSGRQYRDFIYISDVVDAIIKTLKNKKSNGEIINIGSGKPIKIIYVIKKIQSYINNGQPVFGKIKLRKDEIEYLYPKITKAKKILNWKSKISFKEGLRKTIKFFKEK